MNKIALFPGCFDPFHRQHEQIVHQVLQQFKIDQLWILINQSSEEKQITTTFSHRWQIVANLFVNHPRIKVWKEAITYYTTALIQEIKKDYPHTQFYLILGSDQVNNLDQWVHADNLDQIATIICAPRFGFVPKPAILKKYPVLLLKGFVINNFNSRMIKQGYHWDFLQPQTIDYIVKHRLYFGNILNQHFSANNERLQHSYAVAKLSAELAKRFGLTTKLDLLYVGALFHDVTKDWTPKQHLDFWKQHHLDTTLLTNSPLPLWHAYSSAYYLQIELQIKDRDVFEAIFYHTTARINLNELAKMLFIADKLEPNKQDPAFNEVKKLLTNDQISLDKLFQATAHSVYQSLRNHNITPNQDLETLCQQIPQS